MIYFVTLPAKLKMIVTSHDEKPDQVAQTDWCCDM